MERYRQPPGNRRSKSRVSAKAVGTYVPRIARAVFEAHGFPSAEILSDWPAIAGPELAAYTAPERLVWPRRSADNSREDQTRTGGASRRQSGATLVLRVDGPRSIEVQHGAPRIIERINAYFGYRAVATVRIIQGPVVRNARTEKQQAPAPPPDEEGLDRIEDNDLRAALARLGARVG